MKPDRFESFLIGIVVGGMSIFTYAYFSLLESNVNKILKKQKKVRKIK